MTHDEELNKAADEIIKDWLAYGYGDFKQLVIAGAKWEMEQGVIGEGEIVKDISNKLAVTAKIPELSADFKFGEKVIVQIRKKDD